MKFLIILALVSTIILSKFDSRSQSIPDEEQKTCQLNLRKLFAFLEESLHKFSVCISGCKVEVSGDFLRCVKDENSVEEVQATDANDCPSSGCPANPTCKTGFHLLVHGENCCCVKEDIANSCEDETPAETTAPTPMTDPIEPSTPLNKDFDEVGDHLVIHEDNCCCAKEDVAKKHVLEEPRICPLCSMDTAGDVNCSCISPHKIFDSIVGTTSKCCF